MIQVTVYPVIIKFGKCSGRNCAHRSGQGNFFSSAVCCFICYNGHENIVPVLNPDLKGTPFFFFSGEFPTVTSGEIQSSNKGEFFMSLFCLISMLPISLMLVAFLVYLAGEKQ